MSLHRSSSICTALILLGLGACDDGPSAPDDDLYLGYIEYPGMEPLLYVEPGNGFVFIYLQTYGSACTEADHADIDVNHQTHTIVVRPYDRRTAPDEACAPDSIKTLEHWENPGVPHSALWTVRVEGRAVEDSRTTEATITRQVMIIFDNPNDG